MTSFIQSLVSFAYDPLMLTLWAAGIILFLTLLTFFVTPQKNTTKLFFFISISGVAIAVTVYLIAGTIQLVNLSHTKGPVHWHADFRIFNCGEEIDLLDPSGLSNKIGTPLVHEHGDKRIHIEGIPETEDVASLKYFVDALGGSLEQSRLRVPTNEGWLEIKNGDMCAGAPGTLQTFVWKTENDVATQSKLDLFSEYSISPEALVPPGDCVIFEFGTPKERTEHICEQYLVAEQKGNIVILKE